MLLRERAVKALSAVRDLGIPSPHRHYATPPGDGFPRLLTPDNAPAHRAIPEAGAGLLQWRPSRMNADLEQLVRLQHAESELKRAESIRSDLPRRRAEAAAALEAEKARLTAAREAVDSGQKNRRRLEGELQDLESKRSKYKGQLMDVKTNKEYTAMLHEIEGVEREIRAREDLIIAEMESAETLGAEVKREEQAFKAADEAAKVRGREMDEEEKKVQAETARLLAERDAIAKGIPQNLLDLFTRVARVRGIAVSEAKDGKCSQCHLTLRPQTYVDLKRGDQLFQCVQCNRILYYEAPAPVVVPQQM